MPAGFLFVGLTSLEARHRLAIGQKCVFSGSPPCLCSGKQKPGSFRRLVCLSPHLRPGWRDIDGFDAVVPAVIPLAPRLASRMPRTCRSSPPSLLRKAGEKLGAAYSESALSVPLLDLTSRKWQASEPVGMLLTWGNRCSSGNLQQEGYKT